MSTRALLVCVGLLAVSSGALAQPAGQKPAPPSLPEPERPPAPVVNEKSVDDLLAELEQLRAHKAEVEKKEQELTAALRKKLQIQTERLQKLGVAPKDTTHAEPDRVGRIIIEGNTKTPDKKILENLDLRPGQLLRYPALEVARVKLEKAGLPGTTVEVVASELDPKFKDIRIRVNEPGPGAAAPRPQP